jgi:hypothetical protein
MPAAVRWFAEYQPVTPVINTVRGLLIGGPIGDNATSCRLAVMGRTLSSRDLPVRAPPCCNPDGPGGHKQACEMKDHQRAPEV